MRKKNRTGQYRLDPLYFIMVIGFLSGIMIPNIFWRETYAQAGMVSGYLMECLADIESERQLLFFEVCRKRLGMAIMMIVCGISVLGVPTALLISGIYGFELGSIMAVSILQFGVQGGLLGSGLLFPQHILYIPSFLAIGKMTYRKSLETWRGKNGFEQKFGKYVALSLMYLVVILLGGCLETVCTPQIMKFLIQNLKIF